MSRILNLLLVFITSSTFFPFGLDAQEIVLKEHSTNYNRPIGIENAGDERLFIVEQDGRIQLVDTAGNRADRPFLDIGDKITSRGNEQGLLGLAFHPNFQSNGRFFVNYTNTSGNTVVAEYKVSSDRNIADPQSERILLQIDQPYGNHNGGCIAFGPLGYLFIGMGDGGLAGDPKNSGQDPNALLGKMLRIDVDGGTPYAIPEDNPYVDQSDYRDEIWAMGMRNPWRFSFDFFENDIWIADVGQDKWEEIDHNPDATTGGRNYGWRCYEASYSFKPTGCDGNDYIDPVFEYPNESGSGCSVTGGYVYRGTKFRSLFGAYLFTDYCSGKIWATKPLGEGFYTRELGKFKQFTYSSFGEDVQSELYLADREGGKIMRVEAAECEPVAHFNGLSENAGRVKGNLLTAGFGNQLSYQWYIDGQLQSETSHEITLDKEGTYRVVVENRRACRDTAEIDIWFRTNSLNELKTNLDLQLYPNPANQFITLSFNKAYKPDEIQLLDFNGRLIKRIQPWKQSASYRIELAGLSKGRYLINLKFGEDSVQKSFQVN